MDQQINWSKSAATFDLYRDLLQCLIFFHSKWWILFNLDCICLVFEIIVDIL
jgi:hypothetical protein